MIRPAIVTALLLALLALGPAALAQTGPVTAIEKAVQDAIAKSQESVVALARVRKEGRDHSAERFDAAPGIFQPEEIASVSDPTNPNFVPQEYGSGVAIDRAGLLVTTYHVLGDISKNDYYIWSNRKPYKAEVLAADPWMDLAVLKIDAELKPIKYGDAKSLKKGQFVIALGNPYAIAKDGRASAKWGLVSNLNREAPPARPRKSGGLLKDGKETLHHYGTLIETDARLERGTSGGALINLEGEMVGLTTSYSPANDIEVPAGFCIPVDQAFKDAVDKLKVGRKAEFGVLGVKPSNALSAPGKHGVVVEGIGRGTPAAEVGFLSREDAIGGSGEYDTITHIEGEEVEDFNHLIMLLSRLPAGKKIQVTVERTSGDKPGKSRVLQKQVTLFKKYIDTLRPTYATVVDPAWRGLRVDYTTALVPDFRREQYIDGSGCVGAIEVELNSPAWNAGLRPSCLISHVGDVRVTTPAQFNKAVENKTGSVRLRMIDTQGATSVITIPAPNS
jgi:serine protease Do